MSEKEKKIIEEKKKDIKRKKRVSLSKKLAECTDSLLRLRAEFENSRKRLEREKAEFVKYANYELIRELLVVLDNFEHALKSLGGHDKKVVEGIEIIYNQFRNILEKEGLERIKTKGEKFDPRIHHAVMQEESSEHSEDTVIEEIQPGYRFRGKLIRAAMVKVAKNVQMTQSE
ncbi:MAG: nucleotide exchange factor GrpE [Candidatus Omnitrophica bacterium]|nr:nucleotide exchange factor GrpE [Candidatus Omnitrophota bacterium]